MADTIRVGILGAGAAGAGHATAFSQQPDVAVTALWSQTRARAERLAAKLHLGAAIKNADPVVGFTEIMIHELLLKAPLNLQDGYLEIPEGPGLGLELDDAKIEAFKTRDLP